MPRRIYTAGLRGFTLIELVISIVALAALFAGIATVFIEAPAASADPQIRAQARAIAEGYMEEILLKAYENPEPAPPPESGNVEDEGTPPEREERAEYDDVWDYCAIGESVSETPDCDGGTENPTNQNGDPMAANGALDDYEVEVIIEGNFSARERAEVHVTVSHSSGRVNYELVSQRADY